MAHDVGQFIYKLSGFVLTNNVETTSNVEQAAALDTIQTQNGNIAPNIANINDEEAGAKNVREISGTLKSIGDSNVTAAAEYLLGADHEPMVWQESPSLALIVWPILKFLFLTIVAFSAVAYVETIYLSKSGPRPTAVEEHQLATDLPSKPAIDQSKKRSKTDIEAAHQARSAWNAMAQARENLSKRAAGWASFRWIEWARNGFVGILLLALLERFARIKTTRYRMSTQRLILDRGILSRTSIPIELHKLSGAIIHQPFLLRLFKTSNVHVSGILLEGLRNAELVRDLIRNAGQMEAQRTDKIRWR